MEVLLVILFVLYAVWLLGDLRSEPNIFWTIAVLTTI